MDIIFKTGNQNVDLKSLLTFTRNIERTLENYNDLEDRKLNDIDADDLLKILRLSEILSTSCRNALEICSNHDDEFNFFSKVKSKNFDENLPVYAESFENYLYIFSPFTFKRSLKNSFNLSQYLKASLMKLKENGEFNFKAKGPYSFVVIRKTKSFKTSEICDNDNMETSQLVNTVFRFLGTSDSPTHCDFVSYYEQCEDDEEVGLHIYLVPKIEFKDFLDEKMPKLNAFMVGRSKIRQKDDEKCDKNGEENGRRETWEERES